MWKRDRARSAKVHACGAQLNREFQEISKECEGGLKIKDARAGALEAPEIKNFKKFRESARDDFAQILMKFWDVLSEFRR